jgi:hypothetical protein
MRYLVVVAALCGLGYSSWASAAPFDDLANRLEQFDEQDVPRRTRERLTDDQGSPRTMRTRDHFASFPETRTAQAQPQPDSGPSSDGPYDNEPMWDDGDGCCDGGSCNWTGCRCRQIWGRAEFLEWWIRGSNTPPLISTSPQGTPTGVAGVLPGASVLFGDQRINGQGHSGGRFTLGYWFDPCATVGIEDTFLFLGNIHQSFQASSNGNPILARPFFNTVTGQQDAVLLAFPNIVVGAVNITSGSQVYGNEVNLRRALYADDCRRVDVLAGYRFFQFNEGLRINTNTTSIDPSSTVPVGTTFGVFDSFNTRNQFNGGQLGINSRYSNGCWGIDLLAKLALGGMTQTVRIDGGTVVTVPQTPAVSNTGGILAQNSNIGSFQRTRFSVIPEFGVNLHRNLGQCWRANLGYTVMVITNVARPGDQISTQLDPNQFPPPATAGPFTFPAFAFHDSDIWLQGINVGLEYNF